MFARRSSEHRSSYLVLLPTIQVLSFGYCQPVAANNAHVHHRAQHKGNFGFKDFIRGFDVHEDESILETERRRGVRTAKMDLAVGTRVGIVTVIFRKEFFSSPW